ncbi:hypothetical protein KIF24_01800 [Micromonospora sp. Llam7]|uniref:hypothetical protein n=1 Tax=Micromonospora tarapacensis TaxID=2835305 RepID=UPI001C8361AE|nr:hypothetical protein [Micromonospora tarapacensis]MBX7264908.1 hypothetical protein [Micromonospora tarapacensis]
MRPVEGLLLAGAVGVAVLQSPTGRSAAAAGIGKAVRGAGPTAGRVGTLAAGAWAPVSAWRRRSPGGGPDFCPLGCDWSQPHPSIKGLDDHLRKAHRAAPAAPAPAPATRSATQTAPASGGTRPAEEVTEIAPGVRISRTITQVIDKIGLHMDEFRAVNRALAAAGEIEPKTLLQLLEVLTGVQTALTGVANLVNDVTDYADRQMWVDLRAVSLLYDAAGNVLVETQTIRAAMKKIRDLYAEEIAVEEKADEGKVRPLNPQVVQTAA